MSADILYHDMRAATTASVQGTLTTPCFGHLPLSQAETARRIGPSNVPLEGLQWPTRQSEMGIEGVGASLSAQLAVSQHRRAFIKWK